MDLIDSKDPRHIRCFVARQLSSQIYALSSVKFSGLKLRLCKKMTNIRYAMDQWTNGPIDIGTLKHLKKWKIGTLEHWNIGTFEHSTFNQQLVTSIALILFKRLRVTLLTSIASRD